MKSLVFTGMMGSGKSSVGSVVSNRLGMTFIDVDEEIIAAQNMSINDIFQQKGESYFRKVEEDIVKQVFESENMVLSLGGGAFESENTKAFLLANANVVYLRTSPEVIYKRISQDNSRPLLKNNMNVASISHILSLRLKNYEKAHYTVDTDNKTLDDVVQEVLKWIL